MCRLTPRRSRRRTLPNRHGTACCVQRVVVTGAGGDQVRTHRGTGHQQSASTSGGRRVDRDDDIRPDHRRAGSGRPRRTAWFRAFTMRRRNTRMGHNPRTGEAVSVKEKMRPFFKAGKELRVRLNRKPSRPASAHHSTNVPNKREPLGVSRAPAKGHPRNNGTWMCIAAPHLGLLPGRPLPGGGGHRLHHPERGVGNDRGTGRDGPGSAPPPPPATPRPSLMRSPRIGPARVSRPPART
jgi:hypothetical protein